MKTTIDIPDALAAQAKALAHSEGSTLREMVVAGLRHELARRSQAPDLDFDFPTFAGEGLAVPPGEAIAHSYGLPT